MLEPSDLISRKPLPLSVIDLRKFARLLPPEHAKLAKLVRKWVDAHSVSADIRMARDYLADALRWHYTRRDSLKHASTALLHSAVMLYARATERGSDHRSHVPIADKCTADQMELHNRLLDIRNESLAHFGPAGGEKSWSEDLAVMIVEGQHWQPAVASRRSLMEPAFTRSALHFMEALLPEFDRVAEARLAVCQNAIGSAATENDVVAACLTQALIDPQALGEAASILLTGKRQGRALRYSDEQGG